MIIMKWNQESYTTRTGQSENFAEIVPLFKRTIGINILWTSLSRIEYFTLFVNTSVAIDRIENDGYLLNAMREY